MNAENSWKLADNTNNIKYSSCLAFSPMDEDVSYQFCVICGSEDHEQVPKASTLKESFRDRSIFRCRSCGLAYADSFEREDRDRYFRVLPLKSSRGSFERSLKWIEKFKKPSKLLEVGAHEGLFLKVARDRGWQVYGVEESGKLRETAKKKHGMFINPGTVHGMKKKFSGFFDAVVLWNVLEISEDPEGILKECSALLKKDGIIYVNYVDYESSASRVAKSRWLFLSEGKYYFSKTLMDRLLDAAGFRVFNHRTHWQDVSLDFLTSKESSFLQRSFSKFFNALRVQNLNLTLPLGQSGLIAVKKDVKAPRKNP